MTIDTSPSSKCSMLKTSSPNILKKAKKLIQPKIGYFFKQSPQKLNFLDYNQDSDNDEFTRIEEESFTIKLLNRLRKEKGLDEPEVPKETILPPQKLETPVKLIPEINKVSPKTPLPMSRKIKPEVINTEEQLEKLVTILSYPLLLENLQRNYHENKILKYESPSPYAISNFHRNEDKYKDLLFDDTLVEEEEFITSLLKAWGVVNHLNEFEDFKPWFTPYSHYSNMMARILMMMGYNLVKETELIFQTNFKHLPQEVRTRAFKLLQTVESRSPDRNLKLTNKCPECPFRTESKLILADHRSKPHHAFKKCVEQGAEVLDYYYPCKLCKTTNLKSGNDITYHMAQAHSVSKTSHTPTIERVPCKYTCSSCSYEVNTKRYYDKHVEKCVGIGVDDAFGLLSVQRNYHAYNPCKFEGDNRRRPDLNKFYANVEYSVKVESVANSCLEFPLEPYDTVLGLNTFLDKVASKVKELSSIQNEEGKENEKQDLKANVPSVEHLKEIQNIEKSICSIAGKDYHEIWMKPKGPPKKRQRHT